MTPPCSSASRSKSSLILVIWLLDDLIRVLGEALLVLGTGVDFCVVRILTFDVFIFCLNILVFCFKYKLRSATAGR